MTRELGQIYTIFLLLRILLVSGSIDFFELNNAQYEFNIDTKPLTFDEVYIYIYNYLWACLEKMLYYAYFRSLMIMTHWLP